VYKLSGGWAEVKAVAGAIAGFFVRSVW